MVDVFHGNEPLADSVNHLLVVGFYLINLGYVSLQMKIGDEILNPRQSMEALATKVGLVLLVLGAMHFMNLYIFSKVRSASIGAQRVPYPPTHPYPPSHVETPYAGR